MSISNWIAALVLGAFPLSTLADPLGIHTGTSGRITSTDNFPDLGGNQHAGAPVSVFFDVEYDMSLATVANGTLTTVPKWDLERFGISIGGTHLNIEPNYMAPSPWIFNGIRLQDNVRNAAGKLVDVFELHGGAYTHWGIESYFVETHLEFCADTFSDLDAWSILALKDAKVLDGTLHFQRSVEGWDATWDFRHLYADIDDFDVRFDGPGAIPPPVPEPAQFALLLAGLTGMAGMHALRRRRE